MPPLKRRRRNHSTHEPTKADSFIHGDFVGLPLALVVSWHATWRDQAEHAAESRSKGNRVVIVVGSSSGLDR